MATDTIPDTIKIEIKGVVAPSNQELYELMENLLHQIEDRVEPSWFDYDEVTAKAGIWCTYGTIEGHRHRDHYEDSPVRSILAHGSKK